MAKKNYYILSEGILKRKENTIYFHNNKGKKPIYETIVDGEIKVIEIIKNNEEVLNKRK